MQISLFAFRHVLALFLIVLTALAAFYFVIVSVLPPLEAFDSELPSRQITLTDRYGKELYRLSGNDSERVWVPLRAMSPHVLHAFIAVEDELFFDRSCIDIRAIMRAVYANIRSFKSQGGSTITQQLIRNVALERDKVFSRKIKELFLACQLEWRYEKSEILEQYLNAIAFGNRAIGIEQASQTYFGVSASDLTLAQAAVLASLPQRPTYFNPYGPHRYTQIDEELERSIASGRVQSLDQISEGDPRIELGLIGRHFGQGRLQLFIGGRADHVLARMRTIGFITDQEKKEAREDLSKLSFQSSSISLLAPHFVFWVRDRLGSVIDTESSTSDALTIETTLNWSLQHIAQRLVAQHTAFANGYGAHNIALLAIDPFNGDVLAHVGNADYRDEEHDGQVDMVRAPRQPGSSFKPFVYAAAFLQGYRPETVLNDTPISLGTIRPSNYDGTFWGPISIRQALIASRNIPAIIAYYLAGREDSVLNVAANIGVPAPRDRRTEFREKQPSYTYGWSLALGTAEAPLWQMLQGYRSLLMHGATLPVRVIRQVVRSRSVEPFSLPTSVETQGIATRVADDVASMLRDSSNAVFDYLGVEGLQLGAKTGTSSVCFQRDSDRNCLQHLPRDVWVLGFSPRLVVGVWVGNADGSPLHPDATGIKVAAPLWQEFMRRAHQILE